MRKHIDNFFVFLLGNWKLIVLFVAVIGAFGGYLLSFFVPSLKENLAWLIPFGSFAGIAVLLILLEIRAAVLNKSVSRKYTSMTAASRDILHEIRDASRRQTTEPVEVHIVGMRLTTIGSILMNLFKLIRQKGLGRRHLSITVYHIDPDFLEKLQLPAGQNNAQSVRKFEPPAKRLRATMEELTNACKDIPHASIKFVRYRFFPFFYAYVIDNSRAFWGYFTWDDEITDWIGPDNPCFYIDRSNEPFPGFFDWVQNKCLAYDAWEKAFTLVGLDTEERPGAVSPE